MTSRVRAAERGRSSRSEISSSVNSSPYRSRQALGYQRSSRAARRAASEPTRAHCRAPARAPVQREAAQADLGDAGLRGQVRLERGRPGGGEPVGPPTVFGFERLDQALRLKPGERLVEGAGREAHSGEPLDVLGERVPVLGAVGQARQDQRGRARVPAEPGQPAAPSAADGRLPAARLVMTALYIGIRYIVNRYRVPSLRRAAGQTWVWFSTAATISAMASSMGTPLRWAPVR